MIRPGGKAKNIAVKVMKGKGIKVPTATSQKMKPLTQPYLQHQALMKKSKEHEKKEHPKSKHHITEHDKEVDKKNISKARKAKKHEKKQWKDSHC